MPTLKTNLLLWVLATPGLIAEPTLASEHPTPIHLDDIHFIVTDEDAAVAFFQRHFGAREMAHPGERFNLVRFLSLKWQGPTITITGVGPYPDLPPDRNQRWLDATLILPSTEQASPVYGARWLAIATPSLGSARARLEQDGVEVIKEQVVLPMEKTVPAFSIAGPDGVEIVIVERPDHDFGDASFKIDHIQFLVSNVDDSAHFFAQAFNGQLSARTADSRRLTVADADLVISNPRALGIAKEDLSPRQVEGTIRAGLDHLGFLYENVSSAADAAIQNGISPIFPPQRYVYKGKPTVYTFTAFKMPDDFNIEMVQADGRVGPHSYYMENVR